jgi:hypothetical protein
MVLLLYVAMSHRGQSRPFHGAGPAVKNHVEKAIRKKESGRFFEKKLRKKLLLPGGRCTLPCKINKSLLRSFSTEKRPLSFTYDDSAHNG